MIERPEILRWLVETREDALRDLWQRADETRRETVGDAVHLRGLIEISNHCVRQCHYCGIRANNARLSRYRMRHDEILDSARSAANYGYGTVVLQAGEDPGITEEWMEELIHLIKGETRLAVTLSLGERSIQELQTWREAGADRYLLRFETSNRSLYRNIHPSMPGRPEIDRLGLLREMRAMGYEIGSGAMIGIPGQTFEDLADDLVLFRDLDLDMIGVGPFIPHPMTPLGESSSARSGLAAGEQVPNTELMTYKVVALTRLVCPEANIPSTTALATLNLEEGREWGLQRGANVFMPNCTPMRYRVHYEIYPAKACIREDADRCHECVKASIKAIGRVVGQGPGASLCMLRRRTGAGNRA